MSNSLPKLPKAIIAPLDLLIDAFPNSSISLSAVQGVICITAITVAVESIRVSRPAVEWITSFTPTYNSQSGTLVITLKVTQNTGEARSTELVVECAGEALGEIRVLQFSGAFVQFRQAQQLNMPMNMDYGIAAKFLAKEVAEIPEPFTIIGVIVVAILILMMNVLVAIARHAFVNVPEPAALAPLEFGIVLPPRLDLTATSTTVEDNLIMNQTLLTLLYFVSAVFDGDQ